MVLPGNPGEKAYETIRLDGTPRFWAIVAKH
jgi:hypothetical protein